MKEKNAPEMEMTEGEILTSYREAKDKRAQIGILADLNQCTKEVIIEVLKMAGVDGRELPRAGGSKKTHCLSPQATGALTRDKLSEPGDYPQGKGGQKGVVSMSDFMINNDPGMTVGKRVPEVEAVGTKSDTEPSGAVRYDARELLAGCGVYVNVCAGAGVHITVQVDGRLP